MSSTADQNELAEPLKYSNRCKTNVVAYNMAMEETLEIVESLKATNNKLAVAKYRMYALRRAG